MSQAHQLLDRLEKVRQTGPDSWSARCPSHQDRSNSLSIRETEGKVLVHCFAGCSVHEVVGAVGLQLQDLFPPRESTGKPLRQPFPAMSALRALTHDAATCLAASRTLQRGEALGHRDHQALAAAAGRFASALNACQPQARGNR